MITAAMQRGALWVAAALLVSSWAAIGVQQLRVVGAQRAADQARANLEKARGEHAEQREAWAEGSRQAEATHRETEQLRRMARDRIIDDARSTIARQDAAAGQLRSTAQQLRDHIPRLLAAAASAGEAAGDPAAAAGGATAAGPGLVLAELYRGADLEAVELAEAFDRARGAGLSCERTYDSLTAGPALTAPGVPVVPVH